jgi:hypothetical protein
MQVSALVWPGELEKLPGWHGRQAWDELAPTCGPYVPAGQGSHAALAFSEEKVPDGQGRQAVAWSFA